MRVPTLLVALCIFASLGAAQFTPTPNPNYQTYYLGDSLKITITVNSAFPDVIANITFAYGTVTPDQLTFSANTLSGVVTIVFGVQTENYQLLTITAVGGANELAYTPANYYVSLTAKSLSFAGGYQTSLTPVPVVGESSSSILLSLAQYPTQDVTVVLASDPANAVVFSQTSFAFTSVIKAYPFSYTPQVVTPFTFYWTFSGTNAADYTAPNSTNLVATKRNLVNGGNLYATAPAVGITSSVITLSLDYLPPATTPLTVTPISGDGDIIYTPLSQTFTSTNGVVQFTYAATATGPHVVEWALSGTDASWYNSFPNQTITTNPLTFVVTNPTTTSYVVGQPSASITVSTIYPPASDVSLTITAISNCNPLTAGVVLSTNVLDFTPGVLSQSFTVTSTGTCTSVTFTAVVGGTNQALYVAPVFSTNLQFTSLGFTILPVDSTTIGTIHCGDSVNLEIILNAPPPNGFTATLSAPGASFSQSVFAFTPSTTSFFFTLTASYIVSSFSITWSVTGTDSPLVSVGGSSYIASGAKHVTVPTTFTTPGSNSLFVGSVSGPAQVKLDYPPANSDLTVAVQATGLTFSPDSIPFTSTQTSQPLTVSGAAAGTYPTTWSISGTDSACYVLNSPIGSITVVLLTMQVSPNYINNPIVGIETSPYTVTIADIPAGDIITVTPEVTDQYGQPVAAGIYTFTPLSAQLTSANPTATFTFVLSSPRSYDIITFTTDSTGLVANVPLTLYGVQLRTFTTPYYLTTNYYAGAARPAYVIVGIESLPYVVSVQYLPPTGVTLTPSAPNTVFNPPSLDFGPDTGVQTFTILTSVGSGAAGSVGTITTITWTVSGVDANIYSTPATNAFYANLRTLTAANLGNLTTASVVINAPISFTIETPYPPEDDVTITPYGTGFTFGYPSYTLAAGQYSVAISITPTTIGDAQIVQFTLSGTVAADYQALAPIYISVDQSEFSVALPAFPTFPPQLVYGTQPYILTITADSPPETFVNVTVYSQQLTFNPSYITFTPTSLVGTVQGSPTYTPFAPAGTISFVNLEFVLSGDDAADYYPPFGGYYNFEAIISGPPRQLTTSGNINLAPGRNATFYVSSSLPPLVGVTITPTVVADSGYWFSPASAPITPDDTTVVFTVGRSNPAVPTVYSVTVTLSVSGADAFLYANNPGFTIFPTSASISIGGLSSTAQYKIGTTYQVTVSLGYPPTSGTLTVQPYVITGQPIDFGPAPTFTAGSVYNTFTFQATSRGGSQIGFEVTGPSATEYNPLSDFFLTIIPATIKPTFTTTYAATGGVTVLANSFTLSTPVQKDLEITLNAPGFTFSPNPVLFGTGDISQSFSYTATSNQLNTYIETTLSGSDSDDYTNPCVKSSDCPIYSGSGTVYASVSSGSPLQSTITFQLSAGTSQGLTITPSIYPPSSSTKRAMLVADDDDDVTFVPSVVTFSDPSVTVATVTVYSTTPGSFNLFYSIGGPASSYYSAQYPDETANPVLLTFAAPTLGVSTVPSVQAGTLSQQIVVTPSGVAPGVSVPTVTITPSSNPAGLTFVPPSITINQSLPVTFQYEASATGTFVISYALSGPGASVFSAISAQSLTVSPGAFVMPNYVNLFMSPNSAGATFVAGVTSQWFTIYARSVVNNVSLSLYSSSLNFEPSTLYFNNHTYSAEFRFTPTAVGPIIITYSVGGADAALWTTPAPVTTLRATYKVSLPIIPTLSVGIESPPIALSIWPAPTDSFFLTLGYSGVALVLSPTTLVYTPGETTKYFTIVPTAVNIPTPYSGGVNIPGNSPSLYSQLTTLSFTGRDASEVNAYIIPVANPLGVVVGPGWFTVSHPRYQLDVASKITVTINGLPRADVTLSLFSNNLELTPPYITFTRGGASSQTIAVVPRQTTSYELDYLPFKVDYVLSGTNAADYLVPSESLHYFAIPMGYIAAIVLIPLFIIILLIAAFVFLRKSASS